MALSSTAAPASLSSPGPIGVLAGLVTVVAGDRLGRGALRVSDLTTVSAAAAATVFSLRARLHGAVRRL